MGARSPKFLGQGDHERFAKAHAGPRACFAAEVDASLRPFFPTEMDATVAPNGVVGNSNTADIAIETGYCAANNRIHHNTFENGAEGVFTYSCDNTQIYSNTFQNLSDCGVLASDAKQVDFHRKSTQDGPRVASMSDQGRVAIKQ